MSFSWGGAKCTETFSYSMYSILFPFRNHTGLFKTNVTDTFDCTSCAGYGNYQLQSCCANLGSTQTSCLDCGTCSRGYAADTFPYGYSSHSFLCLLYFFFFFFTTVAPGCFRSSANGSAPTGCILSFLI